MSDQKKQLNLRYFTWLLGTTICTAVPVALLIQFDVVPEIVAGCVGLGVFAGGLSGAMTSAYRLGVRHGAASAPATGQQKDS